MLVSARLVADFSQGCTVQRIGQSFLATHPALRCANWSVPEPYLGILGAADLYSTLQLGPGPWRMLDTDFAEFTISTPGE